MPTIIPPKKAATVSIQCNLIPGGELVETPRLTEGVTFAKDYGQDRLFDESPQRSELVIIINS